LSDVLLFCDSFLFVFGLKIFFNSLPISTYESISDVLLFCDSLCLVLVFSTVLPFPPIKQGLSDVAWILSLCLVLYFSTVLPISTYKAGLSDVLLFVIPFFVFGLKSIFQQSHPPIKQGLSDVLLFVILCVWSMSSFSTVLPNSHL
jgi:hypothetical protein